MSQGVAHHRRSNPRQIRDFAKGTGQLAKTDRLDAGILALFAERVRPTPRPLPDEITQLLDALLTRRRQLLEMLVAARNRLGFAPRPRHRGIQQHTRWLERQLDDVTTELAEQIERRPVWRAQDHLLPSVPGVGRIISAVLLAALPELGALTREQVATLAGVAPWARDSGTLRGKRMVWGGRAGVRTPSIWRRCAAPGGTRRCGRSTNACAPPASRGRWRSSPAPGNCSRFSTRWCGTTPAGGLQSYDFNTVANARVQLQGRGGHLRFQRLQAP